MNVIDVSPVKYSDSEDVHFVLLLLFCQMFKSMEMVLLSISVWSYFKEIPFEIAVKFREGA